MNLEQLSKRDSQLGLLLARSQEWRKLDALIKPILPANLQAHIHVACVERGCLVLLVSSNMAASRLHMLVPSLLPRLQQINPHISEIRTKLSPRAPEPEKKLSRGLSDDAIAQFRQSAEKLQHHPELAAALHQLAARHCK